MPSTGPNSNARSTNASSSRTVFWQQSMMSSRTALVMQSRSLTKAWNRRVMPSQCRLSSRTLAMFGGFTEGLQLFASFAMLMNFPRFNKMKGMGQIVSWSVRDESLHCEGIIKLFHAFVKERGCFTPAVKDGIMDMCFKTVRLEDAFVDLAFELGPVEGMSADDIKLYVRYIADWRLGQLHLPPIYKVK